MVQNAKMKVVLCKDDKAGEVALTTDSPASRYGIPVLRVKKGLDVADYGPGDYLLFDREALQRAIQRNTEDVPFRETVIFVRKVVPKMPGPFPGFIAGHELIEAWVSEPERTPEEVEAAKLFLSQWPDGPRCRLGNCKAFEWFLRQWLESCRGNAEDK